MDKKILCICQNGNCRSVATRYCLKQRGYRNVIAIGWHNTTDATLKMLGDWADIILVAKPYHAEYLASGRNKVNKQFTIGDDKWNNPMNKELHEIINKQLDLIKL